MAATFEFFDAIFIEKSEAAVCVQSFNIRGTQTENLVAHDVARFNAYMNQWSEACALGDVSARSDRLTVSSN